MKSTFQPRPLSFCLAFIFALSILAPVQRARADAEGEADSTNWYFAKEIKGDIGHTTFWGPAKALASTYSLEAQAWNEGGTTGLLSQGPHNKFDDVDGSPVGKEWETQKAEVPAPGTTNAKGYAWGRSSVEDGTLWGTNYVGASLAGGIIKTETMPPGGSGRARGKTSDPWAMDLPFEGANDSLELHTFVELTGTYMTHNSQGSGALGWHLSMDGVSAYSSYLFDYSLTDEGGFASTLLVAPGVRLFLNDFSNQLEFDTLTEVTPSQLKSYLDSYSSASGWDLGATPVRIGMQFAIPNDAPGVGGGDPGMRQFYLHNDVFIEVEEAAPVPEPATLGLMTLALIVFRRRP